MSQEVPWAEPLTPEEKKQIKEDRRLHKAMNAAFHKFMVKFRAVWTHEKYENYPGETANRNSPWKWLGGELIQKIHKYLEKNPNLKIMQVSDRDHSISYLVAIPHYDEISKFDLGTTILHVPQNTDEIPQMFFVRPESPLFKDWS